MPSEFRLFNKLRRWRDLTGDSFSDGLRFDAKLGYMFIQFDNEIQDFVENLKPTEENNNNGIS